MEEFNRKLDLILDSQIAVQTSVIKLNNKIDTLDEKFERKFEETNQRIDALDEKFERKFEETNQRIDILDKKFENKFEETNQRITDLKEDLDVEIKDIAGMFNTVFQHI